MLERTRPRRERVGPGPTGPGDVFSPATQAGGMVTVCHGPYSEELPVGNLSVREIRQRFGDRLDIDPESQAVLDGREVGESAIVREGGLLTFVRKAGEKGA